MKNPKLTPEQKEQLEADFVGLDLGAYRNVKNITLDQMVSMAFLMGHTLALKLIPRGGKPRK